MRWLHKPSSLNWANKKKLSKKISLFTSNTSVTKESLLTLLTHISGWETFGKELSEKSKLQLLSAKDIVELKPLLDKSEEIKAALIALCSELTLSASEESNNTPSL